MTNREAVLQAIVTISKRGWPPSITEISEQVGISRAAVHSHLVKLEQAGRIKRGDGPRAVVVIP